MREGLLGAAIVLLIGATGVFTEMQDSINFIWSVKAKPKKEWLKFLGNRLLSFSLIIGLGCEANQINFWLDAAKLRLSDKLQAFTIQEKGGTMKAVREGIARIEAILPEANKVKRETVPASPAT